MFYSLTSSRSYTLALTCFASALLFPALAFAHITLVEKEAEAGKGYRAIFSVPHGCAGQTTTSVKISLPEGVLTAKPMPKAGWTLTIDKGPYAKTYQVYGRDVKEGAKTITWSGGNLPDDQYDEFIVSVYLAADLPVGQKIFFPTIQTGVKGENHWVLAPVEGAHHHHEAASADAPPADEPAPALLIKAADASPAVPAAAPILFKNLQISQAVARATPNGADIGAAYVTIQNQGTSDDTLVSVATPVAASTQVHEMSMDNGVMKMRELKDGLPIPAGKTVTLQPGGFHVMLMGLKQPLKEGESVTLTLTFAKAGSVPVTFTVGGLGAGGGHDGHDGHDHHDHMHMDGMKMDGN